MEHSLFQNKNTIFHGETSQFPRQVKRQARAIHSSLTASRLSGGRTGAMEEVVGRLQQMQKQLLGDLVVGQNFAGTDWNVYCCEVGIVQVGWFIYNIMLNLGWFARSGMYFLVLSNCWGTQFINDS